jgi:hypothetical protein
MKTVLLATLGLTIAVTAATTEFAEAANWRCVDDPALPECEEALINEIEDMVDANWPSVVTVMPHSLPYTCSRGGPIHTGMPDNSANLITTGHIPITYTWGGDLRSFLIGRYNVAADVLAHVSVTGRGVTPSEWPGTTINYLFQDSGTEVMAPGGSTGVADIGSFLHFTTTGGFWPAYMEITMNWLSDGNWGCVVGPPGRSVQANGRHEVKLYYPISWTHPQHFLDEAIRNQFRSAVRFLVTGTP